MTVPPSVSAVVVTWNSAADVTACLDALLASDTPPDDVVVVDNRSSDDTVRLVRPFEDRVTLLAEDANHGYAEGNLRGAALTHGELLLLVNPDCEVERATVTRLVAHLQGDPRCAAASALLMEPDGSPQFFARREPTFLRSLTWFLVLPSRRDRRRGAPAASRREYRKLLSDPPDTPFDVDCPAAACVLLRRSALPEPFFDVAFPLFFNDVDLYRRLRAAGHLVQVVPDARARHGHGRSHRQLDPAAKRAEQVSSLRTYARRWWPPGLPQLFDLLLLLDALSCLVWARLRPAEAPALRRLARGSLGALGLPGGVPPYLSAGQPRRGS